MTSQIQHAIDAARQAGLETDAQALESAFTCAYTTSSRDSHWGIRMLYIGHFSFAYESRVETTGPEPWQGRFTAVAEAASVSAAIRKFESLIRKTAASMDIFEEVEEIYLDSCIEVKSIPRAGFLGYIALQEGDSSGTISTTLPGVPEKYGASYTLEPETAEEDGPYSPGPLLVLKKARRPARAAESRKHVH